MSTNKWEIYFGVCVADKIDNSRYVKVYCHDILPFVSDKLEDLTMKEVFQLVNDITTRPETINTEITNVVTAEYLDMNFNFSYIPFVRKGQRLLVLKYLDSDKHYWIPLGIDKHLNKPEVFRIFCSDNPEGNETPNDENSYYIEIDTRFRKKITISTCKKDKELFKYKLIIDSGKSKVIVSDDKKREIVLDSLKDNIYLRNEAGVVCSLNKKDIDISTPGDAHILCGNNASVVAKNNASVNAKEITLVDSSGASNLTLNASGVNINTPMITIPNDVTVNGELKVNKVSAGSCSLC